MIIIITMISYYILNNNLTYNLYCTYTYTNYNNTEFPQSSYFWIV